ncbi:caspase-3 [Esox lucius]|uniref:Caspase 3, apoptosis-related cysteine peptidase-like n=1 Tax=Esox lucius TaxID=8010 RepID=A0A3P8XKQ1_ESOLU|nr:caspase-3 [Esox lucius]
MSRFPPTGMDMVNRRETRWQAGAGDEECNRAILVSVSTFDHGVPLCKRPGAKKDNKRLHRTLTRLGYKVEIHTDLNAQEILTLFKTESERKVKECFLAVLSSHGEDGCVFGADGQPVRLSHIFSCFSNTHMESKTKLFFIQACRGGELDDGVTVETDSAGSDGTEDTLCQYLSIPMDTAVMYATTPGYGAFMHPLGAVFLQTLCILLEEEGGGAMELTRLLTRLSHRVAFHFEAKGCVFGGKKEMPCFVSRLTREVFPFARPEKGGANGLSTTTLVDTVYNRPRKPSIS